MLRAGKTKFLSVLAFGVKAAILVSPPSYLVTIKTNPQGIPATIGPRRTHGAATKSNIDGPQNPREVTQRNLRNPTIVLARFTDPKEPLRFLLPRRFADTAPYTAHQPPPHAPQSPGYPLGESSATTELCDLHPSKLPEESTKLFPGLPRVLPQSRHGRRPFPPARGPSSQSVKTSLPGRRGQSGHEKVLWVVRVRHGSRCLPPLYRQEQKSPHGTWKHTTTVSTSARQRSTQRRIRLSISARSDRLATAAMRLS